MALDQAASGLLGLWWSALVCALVVGGADAGDLEVQPSSQRRGFGQAYLEVVHFLDPDAATRTAAKPAASG